jgi:hypothetical protein
VCDEKWPHATTNFENFESGFEHFFFVSEGLTRVTSHHHHDTYCNGDVSNAFTRAPPIIYRCHPYGGISVGGLLMTRHPKRPSRSACGCRPALRVKELCGFFPSLNRT